MQRAHIGWMASVGGVATLVGGLLVLNPQLRRQAQSLANGQTPGELIALQARVQDVAFGAVAVLKDYGLDNSILVMFALLSVVFVAIMMRT